MRDPKNLRAVVAVLWVLIGSIVLYQLRESAPEAWSDSGSYRQVQEAIHEGRAFEYVQGLQWQHNRPPLYPQFLELHASAFAPKVSLTQLAFLFNSIVGLALLYWAATLTELGMISGYGVLISSSMLLSYQNTVLTESIFPGVLALAAVLGARARLQPTLARWLLLFSAQTWLLFSLKPAYRLYPIGILILLATSAVRTKKKAGVPLLLGLFSVLFAIWFYLPAGHHARMETKTDTLVYELLPVLGQPYLKADSPKFTKKEKVIYSKLLQCTSKLKYDRIAHDICGVEVEDGAALYDRLFWRNFPELVWSHTKKMFNVIRFSAWGWDQGQLKGRAGIPKGFGTGGILLGTFVLGIALGGAWFFLSGSSRKMRDEKAPFARALMREAFLLAGYGWLTVMFGSSTDLGRLSLAWVIPTYCVLTAFWARLAFKKA